MSDQRPASEAPDFKSGVPLSSLPDGAATRGKFGDDDVIVVRHGDQLSAIGASCTHYSGPLNEGLLVGNTVRCPWHHACFDLTTGEALRAPALNPATRWRVERRGARVFVTGKLDPVRKARKAISGPERVVIIGGGAAGGAAANMLRREAFPGRITIASADSSAPYDRPNCSKEYLSGHAPAEWMPLWGDDYYRDQEIEVRLNTVVRAIDPRSRKLAVEAGGELGYDALLLATGADPVRLSFPGSDQPHVFTLRTLADSQRIIAAVEGAKNALVIGASFIGLEVAWSLRERGLVVHVVAPEKVPMERVLGPAVGGFVKRLHEEHGVEFHLERTVKAIDGKTALLSDDTRVEAEVVAMGVGVRPSVGLAERARISVENGVLVDEYLATSAPGIWAAGDIARWPDRHSGERIRVEHWVVAERQGQAAALNIMGERTAFDAVPFFWSAHYDKTINYVGHAARWDRVEVDGDIDRGDFIVTYFQGSRRLAAASVGRDLQSLQSELAMERATARA